MALRATLEGGNRPPCTRPDNWRWWTSEDGAERAQAAQLCHGCAITAACRAAADAHRERFGVWAGKDRTTRQHRNKQGAE